MSVDAAIVMPEDPQANTLLFRVLHAFEHALATMAPAWASAPKAQVTIKQFPKQPIHWTDASAQSWWISPDRVALRFQPYPGVRTTRGTHHGPLIGVEVWRAISLSRLASRRPLTVWAIDETLQSTRIDTRNGNMEAIYTGMDEMADQLRRFAPWLPERS